MEWASVLTLRGHLIGAAAGLMRVDGEPDPVHVDLMRARLRAWPHSLEVLISCAFVVTKRYSVHLRQALHGGGQ